jgi:hypothetical protein
LLIFFLSFRPPVSRRLTDGKRRDRRAGAILAGFVGQLDSPLRYPTPSLGDLKAPPACRKDGRQRLLFNAPANSAGPNQILNIL